jgi:hypothetical protein
MGECTDVGWAIPRHIAFKRGFSAVCEIDPEANEKI